VSVLIAIVFAAAVTVWFASARFVPLRADHGGVFSTVRVQTGQLSRVDAQDPSSSRPFVAFDVPYHHGSWMEHGFTLVNDSPFSVTVERIGGSSPADEPLRLISVSINAPDVEAWGPGAPDRMVRFQPFTIPPHDARYVLIRGRFTGCTMDGREEIVRFAAQRVGFRVDFGWLSIDRSAALPLPYSVTVSGNEGCPA
jgi:hypothetical protein